MSQNFVKGRTTNHLTFAMVDSTDFATPESALSAAIKIKIYGKLRADDTVRLVSSGTGSLTNDIKHVGASATGVYTIGLVKADLSDASAAWYDQYTAIISATGAALQVLVVDGGIDASAVSALQSRISDMQSFLTVMSGVQSDLYSLLSDHHSDFQSRVPKLVATNSQLSDLHSDLKSYLAVMSDVLSDLQSDFQSRVPKRVATDSQLSDLHSDLKSFLTVMSGVLSDTYSLLSDHHSDFQSRVPKAVATNSQLSDLHSDLRSFLAVMSGVQSDVYSLLSDFQSDFASRVPKRVATDSQLSDLASDLKSAIVSVSAIASDAHSAAAQANSRILVVQSAASDAASAAQLLLSAFVGHIGSTASAVVSPSALEIDGIDHDDQFNGYYVKLLNGSQVDELRLIVDTDKASSKIIVRPPFLSAVASGVDFVIAVGDPAASDLKSAIQAITVTIGASDISDIASAVVAALPITSQVSDIYSMLSDFYSDFQSRVPKKVATDSQLSDVHSKLSALTSDAHSAATLGASRALVIQSRLSDLDSRLVSDVSDIQSAIAALSAIASDAHSAAAQGNSRILVVQSRLSDFDSRLVSDVSDIRSMLSDMQSDFQSRVPKRVATESQLSDVQSDLKSAIGNITVTIGASDISDIASAVVAALPITSAVSDIYSLLSSFESDFQSRIPKEPAARSQVSDLASDIVSDLKSFIGAGIEIGPSSMSDLRSAMLSLSGAISDAHSAAAQANSRALVTQSGVSDIYSAVLGGMEVGASSMSDLRSAIAANGVLRAGVEPAAVPTDGATLADKVDWLHAVATHRIEQTSVLQNVKDAANLDVIASAAVSDDGTTFVRDSFS